jgi:hypothetical protein
LLGRNLTIWKTAMRREPLMGGHSQILHSPSPGAGERLSAVAEMGQVAVEEW